MNAFINVKSADKNLKFGITKCKSMPISKASESVLKSELLYSWSVQYEDNSQTGDTNIVETHMGLTAIEKTNEQTYLGFVLSARGENMANIRNVKTNQ